ncbi:MAG: hypothetical protein LBQ79_04045, partial [Deltaproteobacteria bacterium]|nr:hypothetical protein [Deltaproteobacteria bacterium]
MSSRHSSRAARVFGSIFTGFCLGISDGHPRSSMAAMRSSAFTFAGFPFLRMGGFRTRAINRSPAIPSA